MLAREYCDDIKRKLKPIILSHRWAHRGHTGVLHGWSALGASSQAGEG